MATILAHITVIAGREERFEAIAEDLYRSSHVHDEGLLRYEYWRGAQPQTYYALLSFTDFSAFIAHQTSAHHEIAAPLIGAVVADLRLEWVDPVQGASELPSTDAQDLAASLDKLTAVYAKRFRAEIAQWWLALRREIS